MNLEFMWHRKLCRFSGMGRLGVKGREAQEAVINSLLTNQSHK